MILEFATRRTVNGNRKYIALNTGSKQYAFASRTWLSRDCFIEISAADYKQIISKCESADYKKVDYCN